MIYIILVLALVLRLINLNQSLWLDEAVQAITAQNSFAYIFQEIRGDFHPPLYYFLMHFWVRIFGSSEIALRLPSVLFGVGTVYLVYRLGKLGGLGRLGLLGAAFLATAPFHIYYSQEARMYSLTCFLAALSMFYFLKVSNVGNKILNDGSSKLKTQSAKPKLKIQSFNYDYLLYFFSTLCLVYTGYYGFLVVLSQGIYLVSQKRYKFLILNTCFLILCYLPWLPMFITQMKTGMLATQNLPDWGKLVNVSFLKAIPLTFIKFTIGRITIFDKRAYAIVAVGLVGFYGWLMARAVKGGLKEAKGWLAVILGWLLVPIAFAWLISLVIPNYQPFRLLLVLPSFYLILAMGVEGQEGERRTRWFLVVLILLINIISLSVYYLNPYFHREDWRGVTSYLVEQKNSVVVLPSETSNWPIKYYDSEGKMNIVYGGIGVEKVGDLRSASWRMGDLENKIFYIRYLVPLFDPNEKILAELDVLDYTKVKEISFNQIPVWEFEKK